VKIATTPYAKKSIERVFLDGVVVGDQVQRLVAGRLLVDHARKLQLFGVGVFLLASADDFPVKHIERCEQRGRAG
jgi:hypothetical protein